MNTKQFQSDETELQRASTPTANPWPSSLAAILGRAEEELAAGRTKQALELLRRADLASPWVANALGVCQLRQGQVREAVDTFRRLTVADHLSFRAGVPAVFKANFATALLLSGNLAGFISTMDEIGKEQHPAVKRLQAALNQWKASLSFWERINWYLGGEPSRAVTVESPGDLR